MAGLGYNVRNGKGDGGGMKCWQMPSNQPTAEYNDGNGAPMVI